MNSISVILSLGANCGDRKESVDEAIVWLKCILSDLRHSGIYETLPIGHAGSNYMNAVVSGNFDGTLEEIERLCKKYEIIHGRDDESRRQNLVPIDIDIVIADGNILRPRDYKCGFFQKGYNEILDSDNKNDIPESEHQYLEALR